MDKIVGRAEVAAFYWLRRNALALGCRRLREIPSEIFTRNKELANRTSFVYCSVGPEICGGAQGGGHPI